MPRIRTIKPEFWCDEKLSSLDPLTRLVFLALMSLADDAGRLVDNVKALDGAIFPSTEDTCAQALDTLARLSRVSRYSVASGQRIIQVSNWHRHQKVDRPSSYVLPAESSRDTRETLARHSRSDRGPWTVDRVPGTLDLGPTTVDRGPTIKDQSSVRETFLQTVTNRVAWEGIIRMAQDGANGAAYKATDAQIDHAIADFLAVHDLHTKPSPAHFRAFIKRAVAGPKPESGDVLDEWAKQED